MARINLELRKRVERLLAGDGHPADLHRIFLALREYNFGRRSFKEVGDFIAHAEGREKGLTIRSARDYATFLRFMLPQWFQLSSYNADANAVAAGFAAALRLKFPDRMADDLGLRAEVVRSTVGAVSRKILCIDRGQMVLSKPFTAREGAVVDYMLSNMAMVGSFTLIELMDDTIYVLLKNRLLEESEVFHAMMLSHHVATFAIAHMNGVNLVLGPNEEAELFTVASEKGLNVRAGITVPSYPLGESAPISIPFFTYPCDPALVCDAELLLQAGPDSEPRLPIFELGNDWKLRILG